MDVIDETQKLKPVSVFRLVYVMLCMWLHTCTACHTHAICDAVHVACCTRRLARTFQGATPGVNDASVTLQSDRGVSRVTEVSVTPA